MQYVHGVKERWRRRRRSNRIDDEETEGEVGVRERERGGETDRERVREVWITLLMKV